MDDGGLLGQSIAWMDCIEYLDIVEPSKSPIVISCVVLGLSIVIKLIFGGV